MVCVSPDVPFRCKAQRDGDGAELQVSEGYNTCHLVGGGNGRISERLLENDSLCYLSPDFTAVSYREERELTVQQPEEEICESDFPSSSVSSPKLQLPLSKKKKK